MSLWHDPAAWLPHNLAYLYAALALFAFLKYTIPVFPGDVLQVACVFLVGARGGSGWNSACSIAVGGTLGAWLAFWWGERFGAAYLKRPRFARPMDRVERLLGRWGYWPLVLNRFVPYVRIVLFPAAGLLKMNALPVAASALAGNALFGAFVVLLAHRAGQEWGQLASLYHYYQLWLGLFVFAFLSLLTAYLVLGAWRSRRESARPGREDDEMKRGPDREMPR